MSDSNFTLAPLGKEEGEVIVAKLKAFLDENNVDLVVSPMINKDGTIGAQVQVFKKLELVPKGSVESPKEFLPDSDGEKA